MDLSVSDSALLLVSIPVVLLVLLVFSLFVFTAVEARKVSVSSNRVPDEDEDEEHSLGENKESSHIEEDLGELYAPSLQYQWSTERIF